MKAIVVQLLGVAAFLFCANASAQNMMADAPKELLCQIEWRRYNSEMAKPMIRLTCNQDTFHAALVIREAGWAGVVTCSTKACGHDNISLYGNLDIQADIGLRCEEFGNSFPKEWSCKPDAKAALQARSAKLTGKQMLAFGDARIDTETCYRERLPQLDDRLSDAKVVAYGVSEACSAKELAEFKTLDVSDENARVFRLIRREETLARVTQIVLEYRARQKVP